ncbi:hypothetical protein L3Q82_006884 [Scortum barcoo]|uniref:Uncharacterized protein n=1 Tax=Scortum barcoo TaxID=214431 RepID=A0ACB8WX34_9TELE|nr:hypothetical protein L3Q82_006884 [Scortum barcoo]
MVVSSANFTMVFVEWMAEQSLVKRVKRAGLEHTALWCACAQDQCRGCVVPDSHHLRPVEKIERTVQIEASTVEIEERGVKLRLTVVDTPGYGDAINSQDCFKTIIQYIDNQFERYLHDESGLNRRHIVDNRVHCCFYFISPFGHGLKPLDVEFMKAIHSKVNIVPVIAKADTLTLRERDRLKRRDELESD